MTDSLTVKSGETDILVRLGRDETVAIDDGGSDLAVHGFGSEHVVQIEGKGPQGSKGEEGDITPELQALHEDTIAAKDRAVTAEDTAEGAAAATLSNKNATEIAYQSTITERQDAVAARQGAETAETNAAAHATTSGQNKTASAASAAAALTSEQNAKTSETNAASHVTTVVTAKDEAVAANTASQLAKTDAQTAATNAGTSETNAEAANTAAQTAKTDTIAARDTTVAARDVTTAARDTTVAARDVTTAARDETVLAKTDAQTAATGAATSETNAVAANDAAQVAKTDTIAARNVTTAARDTTLLARDETAGLKTDTVAAAGTASTARDVTTAARDETVLARDATIAARDVATTAASGAETSEQNTLTHRQAAEDAATNAIASESTATSKATEATTAATTATGARDDTQALLEAFRSAHLGIASADPTTDLNGDPLTGGETYVSSTSGKLRYYNGTVWEDIVLTDAEMDAKIQTAVDNLLAGAPDALDTLNELAVALQDNDSEIASILDQIATKADIGHLHSIADVTGLQDALDAKVGSNHSHGAASATVDGFMTSTQFTKLAGIEAGADVTDAQNVGAAIGGSVAKTTPADADAVTLTDGSVLKRLTWANVKSTLKSYFDSLYASASHGHDASDLSGTLSKSLLPGEIDDLTVRSNLTLKQKDGTTDNPNLWFKRNDDSDAGILYWSRSDDTIKLLARDLLNATVSTLSFDCVTGDATFTNDFTVQGTISGTGSFHGVNTFDGSDRTGTSSGALEISYNSTVTGQGSNKTHFAYNGTHNYIRGERTIIDTPRLDTRDVYGGAFDISSLTVGGSFALKSGTINVGRGDVFVENYGASDGDGAGITLRTSANPTTGGMFIVRSSGGAARLFVGQSHLGTANAEIYTSIGSDGSGGNRVWHAGNFNPASKLDNGAQAADSAQLQGAVKEENTDTPNTIVQRNGSGDIWARLLRSTYSTTNSNIGFIMTQVDTGSNNYVRPSTPAQLAAALSRLVDAGQLDGLNSTQFLRSDVSETLNGDLNVTGNITLANTLSFSNDDNIWFSDSSNRFHFQADGSWTNSTLYCGAVYANGNITAYSDERLKDNIERIENALDKVETLGGYTYDRVDIGERHAGVIAQEIQKVLPEAVQEDDNGMLGVSHASLTGLLIEAIKELRRENDLMRADIEALKAA